MLFLESNGAIAGRDEGMERETLENVKAYIRPPTGSMWVEMLAGVVLFALLFCMAHFVGKPPHPPLPLGESLAVASPGLIVACFALRRRFDYWKSVRVMDRKWPTATLRKDFEAAEGAFGDGVRIGRQCVYVGGKGLLLPTGEVEGFGTRKEARTGIVHVLAKRRVGDVSCLEYAKVRLEDFDLEDALTRANDALHRARDNAPAGMDDDAERS